MIRYWRGTALWFIDREPAPKWYTFLHCLECFFEYSSQMLIISKMTARKWLTLDCLNLALPSQVQSRCTTGCGRNRIPRSHRTFSRPRTEFPFYQNTESRAREGTRHQPYNSEYDFLRSSDKVLHIIEFQVVVFSNVIRTLYQRVKY